MAKSGALLFSFVISNADAGITGCNSETCKGASEYVLPLDHHLLAPKHHVAEQVHLIGGSPGKAGVVWTGRQEFEEVTTGVEHCVRKGTTNECMPGTLKFVPAEGPWTYDAMDNMERLEVDGVICPKYKDGESCFYSSPPHYSAQLEDLGEQSRSHLYRIRGETAWRSFRSTPAVGQPITFGVISDLGQYNDSVATMDAAHGILRTHEHETHDHRIDSVLFGGDLAYANGVGQRWDSYGRLQERLFSKVLTAYAGGNHEVEKGMENWIHYTNRYPAMHLKKDSHSSTDLFYSFEAGLAHVVVLCSYCPSEVGSTMYDWLVWDLAQIDRSDTPWLIGVWHTPWYTSNSKHPMQESDDMRRDLEDIVHHYGFDIVFAGHNHAYERTAPIYKNATVPCGGTTYIMVGDAGGASPHEKTENGGIPEDHNGVSMPWITPENPRPPMFDQPEWSLVRSYEWGFGALQIPNATHAVWNFYHSFDSAHAVKDSATLVKKHCGTTTLV